MKRNALVLGHVFYLNAHFAILIMYKNIKILFIEENSDMLYGELSTSMRGTF